MPDGNRRQAAPGVRAGAAKPTPPRAAEARRSALAGLGNRALQRLVADPGAPRVAAVAAHGNEAVQRLVSPEGGKPTPIQRSTLTDAEKEMRQRLKARLFSPEATAAASGQPQVVSQPTVGHPPGGGTKRSAADMQMGADARNARIQHDEALKTATAQANIQNTEASDARVKAMLKQAGLQ